MAYDANKKATLGQLKQFTERTKADYTAKLAGKADKADTLAGYGISDAYTKAEIDGRVSSVYKPGGSAAFADIPAADEGHLGMVYNVTDAFTTTADFVEGAGKAYPAGTNVVIVLAEGGVYKYDALAGMTDLSGYATKEEMAAATDVATDAEVAEALNAVFGDAAEG